MTYLSNKALLIIDLLDHDEQYEVKNSIVLCIH
jgi:hypothetical protein